MFECNICFETAFEPVVTRCGHLLATQFVIDQTIPDVQMVWYVCFTESPDSWTQVLLEMLAFVAFGPSQVRPRWCLKFVWFKKMQHNMWAIWRWILRTLARSPYGNLQPSNGWSSCPVCKAQCPGWSGCSAQFGYHWIVSICEDFEAKFRPCNGRSNMSVLVRLLCLNRLWRRCMPGMAVVLIQNNGMQICHLGHQAGRAGSCQLMQSMHKLLWKDV